MIYTVDHNSPPRYLIQGADSSSEEGEEPDFKKMRSLKTTALAKSILERASSYSFELEVKFKNPYKKETRVQVIKASRVEVDDLCKKIICSFAPTSVHPLFFSFNYKARYSKVTLFITGPATDNVRTTLSVFRQYLLPDEDVAPYTIKSLNLHFQARVTIPTDETLRTIKPKACRVLFQDEPSVIDAYDVSGEVKLGAITQLNSVTVKIPVE